MKITKTTVTKFLIKLFWIVLAIFILAVGLNMFLAPHDIAAGGLTGLSIILDPLVPLERSTIIYIGNAFVLLIAAIFLGKEVFFNTLIGAALLPFAVQIVPDNIPALSDGTMLVYNPLLSMVVGSVLFGIAVSILYRNNASSGGTVIVPLFLHKYFKMNKSIGLFVADGVVVILSLIVFNIEAFFLAIFSIFITSVAMHYIDTGFNKKKLVYIISEHHQAIAADIMTKVNRGVTIVPIIGAYEKKQGNMLMVTIPSSDYQQLIKIVDEHDKTAFVIVDVVSDVHGKGFTYDSGSV